MIDFIICTFAATDWLFEYLHTNLIKQMFWSDNAIETCDYNKLRVLNNKFSRSDLRNKG